MQQQLHVWLLIAVIIVGGVYAYMQSRDLSFRELFFSTYHTIHVGTTPVEVELATTPEERKRGLSGRDELGQVDGLLMVFDEPGYHGIWMKGMRFPIDVIWISEELKVIDVREHITPNTYPTIFEPARPAKYVLETKAFFVDVYGTRVGDGVVLPPSLTE